MTRKTAINLGIIVALVMLALTLFLVVGGTLQSELSESLSVSPTYSAIANHTLTAIMYSDVSILGLVVLALVGLGALLITCSIVGFGPA